MSEIIRRSVVLNNHFDCIRMITNKAYPTMPQTMKNFMSVDDLFQDCVLELRLKVHKYDASRSRFVTFIYLVLRSYLNRQRDRYGRQKRSGTIVEFDSTVHGVRVAKQVEDENTDEAVRLFLEVYSYLSPRLQTEVRKWFFTRFSHTHNRMAHARTFVVFRRIAHHHGLTEQHCLIIMFDKAVQLRIKRQICTCVRRYI